jgi:hypothetical protein
MPHQVSDNGVWTETRIRGLGAVTDLPTAGRIFGLGRSLAYELAKNDQFPALALHVGSRYRLPVAGIITALGIPAGDLAPAAKWSVDHQGAIRSTGAHDDVYRGEP